jgi:hypothetical protein
VCRSYASQDKSLYDLVNKALDIFTKNGRRIKAE